MITRLSSSLINRIGLHKGARMRTMKDAWFAYRDVAEQSDLPALDEIVRAAPEEDGLVAFRSVTKFPGDNPKRQPILQNADFAVKKGQAIGILGARGSGLTTVVGLLNGNVKPNRGDVVHGMSVSWPVTSRHVFNKNLSLRTNIRFVAEMYGAWPPEMISAVLEIAEVRGQDVDKPLQEVPNDIHSRSVMALCLALKFDCYVADDALFIGNRPFRQKLRDIFSDMKGEHALVIVTSNIQLIRDFCDNAYVLRDRSLLSYPNKSAAIRDFKHKGMEVDDLKPIGEIDA